MNLPKPTLRGKAEEAWELVRKWAAVELTAEPKLAWSYLFALAGGRLPAKIQVHITNVGMDQGAKDAARSGKRSLETLAGRGLLDICHQERGGLWTVVLQDPEEVRRARLLLPDPQRELFPGDESAGVAQLPPVQGNTTLTLHPHMRAQESYPTPGHGSGGSCATPAERPVGYEFGLVVGKALGAKERRPEDAERLAAMIRLKVDDPNLQEVIVYRIAFAVVDGLFTREKLEVILHRTRTVPEQTPKPRGSYFIRAMEGAFRDLGLDLFDRRRPAAAPSSGEDIPL